jgi:hypothetical protein
MSRLVLICGEALLLPLDDIRLDGALVSDAAADAVATLNGRSAVCVLVSAPPVAAEARVEQDMLRRLHERMRDGIAKRGGRLEAILTPEHLGGLTPAIAGALKRFRAAAQQTPVLTENLASLEAAAALGCPRILLRTRAGRRVQAGGIPDELLPVGVHADLAAAVEPVLRLLG